MPNYCYNWVTISGEKELLDELQSKFNAYKENESMYFNQFCDSFFPDREDSDDFYSYGTKWWNYDVSRESDNDLLLNGDSAWAPPMEFLRKLSEQYAVVIRGEYEESGMDFGGYAIYEDGVIDDHEFSYREWSYMNNEEQFFNELEFDAEYYDAFNQFKAKVLDSFQNKLSDNQIAEVREEFQRQQDELKKRINDQISLA
jgi:hypothetical protein